MRIFKPIKVTPRILVYLRQIARELARANDLTEAGLTLTDPKWKLKMGMNAPKLTEITVPEIEDWNKAYFEKHPGMMEE
jgi:hypothetical protein